MSHVLNWFALGNAIETKAIGEIIIRNQNPIIRPIKSIPALKNAHAIARLTNAEIRNTVVESIGETEFPFRAPTKLCGWNAPAIDSAISRSGMLPDA